MTALLLIGAAAADVIGFSVVVIHSAERKTLRPNQHHLDPAIPVRPEVW